MMHSAKVQNFQHDSFQNLTSNCTDEDGHCKLNLSNKTANINSKNLSVYKLSVRATKL